MANVRHEDSFRSWRRRCVATPRPRNTHPRPRTGAPPNPRRQDSGRAGAAGVARGLLARQRQPARVSRAMDAAARRHADRREPDGHAGQDAGLRIPAPRVAPGRRLLRRRAVGQGGDRVPARRADRRPDGGPERRDLHVRQSRGRSSRSGSSIVARRKAGCTRTVEARSSGARPAGHSIRCAAIDLRIAARCSIRQD